MYSRILVPLDGSALAETVLPYVRSFARALDIPAEFLRVIDPELYEIPPESLKARPGVTKADVERESEAYLEQLASRFADLSVLRCSVARGKAAQVIADRAATHAGTIIAMSTHGRTGLERWLLGSVAEKVLHTAKNPVLLVRPWEALKEGEAKLPNKIFVPLDGSLLAELALPHAVELAKRMALELVLLRVYDPLSYGHLPRLDLIAEELREEAKNYLEEKARRLRDQGIERASPLVLEGYPSAQIVDLARAEPEGLLVISTHGRSGISRWLLGSVTERVIRHARGPLLVVPAPRNRGKARSGRGTAQR